MKRLVLTLAVAAGLSATALAAGNQPTTAKWEGNINIAKLSNYLKLSSDQTSEVADISEYFTEQMERATSSKKDQNKLLHNAVYGNLKLMKQTLTTEQYSKYTQLLNITLQNKGIEVK